MELGFSHIAWAPEQETEALNLLRELGVKHLEVAPLRAFGPPEQALEAEVRRKADAVREEGLHISSMQALLFGTEGLSLFGHPGRAAMRDHLLAVARVAGWCGAQALVFGSPKNRLKGAMTTEEAHRDAAPFFREIGDACAAAGTSLVMEANPPAYGADFCTSLEETLAFVKLVDSEGFRLHVDAGGLALQPEPLEKLLSTASEWIGHVHASQPELVDFAKPAPVHHDLAVVLNACGYDGTVAIEMRAQPSSLASVREAVACVRDVYGCH